MTNPIPEYDNSVLLSALLSGGVIGGSLMLVDRGFSERSKLGLVFGIGLGILLTTILRRTQHRKVFLSSMGGLTIFGRMFKEGRMLEKTKSENVRRLSLRI